MAGDTGSSCYDLHVGSGRHCVRAMLVVVLLPLLLVECDCGREDGPGNQFGPCRATDEGSCLQICADLSGYEEGGGIEMNCEPAGVWGLAYLTLDDCEADTNRYPQDDMNHQVPGIALEYIRCCCEHDL